MPIDAPFLTPDQLGINTPGNPALAGGVNINFDPNNKAPFSPLQDTFTRLDTENNQAIQRQNQNRFDVEQLQRQQQHDILTRQMAYDHEDKMRQAAQAMQDKQGLYNMLNQTGASSNTIQGPDGAPLGIPFSEADQDKMNNYAKVLTDKITKDPSGYANTPEAMQDMQQFKNLKNNASMRAIYLAQAKQQLLNTYLPEEKQRIRNYMDNLSNTELDAQTTPSPYISQPGLKSVVADSWKDPKKYVGFDDGDGIPNTPYLSLLNTTDPNLINEGAKKLQFFKMQPEGQSANSYNDYVQHLNELTDARGLPRIDLGGKIDAGGKVQFDDDTYAKRVKLARNHLAAFELTNNGWLQPADEKEAAEIAGKKAATNKTIKETQFIGQKDTAPLTPQQIADQHETELVVNRVRDIFNRQYATNNGAPIDGPGVIQALRAKGYNPKDWEAFALPKGADVSDLNGVERIVTNDKGVEQRTGETERADNVMMLKNTKTGDVKLASFKKNPEKDGDPAILISMVGPREAVGNAAKSKHQYKGENARLSEEISRNEAELDKAKERGVISERPTTSSDFEPKYNGAPVQIKLDGGVKKALVGGLWKKIIARNSKTGEIKVE